jgi:dTDP-glucose 4,6-dehydratase
MSPYAASKAGADRTVYAYGCTYKVPVTILRFFNNYGPGQHIEKLIGKYIVSAIDNQPLIVHGSGSQQRDWIYVIDTARAIDAALSIPDFNVIRNEVINCGSGVAISVLEIANIVVNTCNLSSNNLVFCADRPGQVQKHLASTEKAKRLLNWEPLTSFKEGILNTIDWYKTHPEFWQDMLLDESINKDNQALISEKMKSEI